MEILIFIILGIAVIMQLSYPFIVAQRHIEKWAAENGYDIEEKEVRFFRTGPFFYFGHIAIHRLKVVDKNHNAKYIWTKTGNGMPFSKTFSVKIES